ncbi:hypothetical protein ACJMK2_023580 [Sinanodonta woodiana]|uniref:F-box/LRR-repeat protein 4 n=1 Tax=Sinanodonta woodiana TaxID=1069815 RepID=A0ABD3T608_SINWO
MLGVHPNIKKANIKNGVARERGSSDFETIRYNRQSFSCVNLKHFVYQYFPDFSCELNAEKHVNILSKYQYQSYLLTTVGYIYKHKECKRDLNQTLDSIFSHEYLMVIQQQWENGANRKIIMYVPRLCIYLITYITNTWTGTSHNKFSSPMERIHSYVGISLHRRHFYNKLSTMDHLLKRHCYDSLQYIELNLQPHLTQVTDTVLYSLMKRCSHLLRLNLSWCKNLLLTINGVDTFLQCCGSELTCLYLSTCKFLNNDCLMSVVQYCPNLRELDIDSCLQVDSTGFSQLKNLTMLQRLNLYRTYIDTMSLTAIIRSCHHLRHLNLGSCTCLHFMDDIAEELGNNCRKLKSLDLWRSRSISHEGLSHIYTSCRDLEEIDLGWCPELKSRTLCFVELTQNCTKLKKLFLTANRTVCDEDLLAIAKHCKEMEQLDILGTREVSAFAAQRVLENCKKLIMFDVSFCSGIDFPMMETWKKEFPHCEIKKSYQN